MLNVVCLGGGTGQSEILRGLKKHDCNITAIVAVTDSGRSTGIIRNNFNTIAPGDIRNCIIALSDSEDLIKKLFNYRFDKGIELEGMSFGNLFLTAMFKVKGDMFSAIKETSKILKIRGKVLPSTLKNTHICAELEDGTLVEEELNVRKPNKSKIKKIFLKDKNVKAPNEVINAIKNADLIILGPGSLYTSVLVHFLIPNLKKAFVLSKAKKIFLCNLVTQAGQTDNYEIQDHINEVIKYCETLDYVIVNKEKPNKKIMEEYEKERGFFLDFNKIKKNNKDYNKRDEHNKIKDKRGNKLTILFENVLKKENKKNIEWNKVSSLRHDPEKISHIIFNFILNLKKKNQKIKAVILAAGNSTRLRPFSFSESKTLIKFLGKPLIEFHVEECIKNNIDEIAIVCNKKNIKQMKDSLKKYKKIKYYIQKEQKGTADALISAKEFIKNSFFILKFGDSVASEDEIPKILSVFNKKKCDLVLTLKKVKNTGEFGIAKFKENKLIEIVEKPIKNAPSKLALVGFAILNGDSFIKAFNKLKYEKQTSPQQYLLELGVKNTYWISQAKRIDVGRVWNLLEANKMLIDRYGINNENLDIPISSKISKTSYICPNAIISKNVIIEGYSSVCGFIGENTKIKDSFIMEGTRIGRDCNIQYSVIGKNNNIGNKFKTETKGNDVKIYVKGRYVNPTLKNTGIFTGEQVTIMDNLKSKAGKMIFPNKIIRENIKEDKLIRAILFDADNTLYKTKEVAKKADMEAISFLYKLMLQKNKKIKNKEIIKKEKIYSDWKKIVNKLKNSKNPEKRTRKYSYNKLLLKYKIKNEIKNSKIEIDEKMYSIFLKKLLKEIRLMDGLNKIFQLRSKYKLAVFTEDSYDLTSAKLKHLKIDKIFDLIVTSSDIGQMKPSKDYYKEIFKNFDIDPNECVVVGDNFDKDLKIAKEMGATTILYGDFDKKVDYSINNYNELIKILRKI